ncbi:MAG: transporter substrate-binding domain-containing protein [Geminicoccaceae bacterium]
MLRCAVVLDFPPMGSRDANNEPIGFDVDTCNDLAAALGVEPEYVETPFPTVSRRWFPVVPMSAWRRPPTRSSGPRRSASRSPTSPSRWSCSPRTGSGSTATRGLKGHKMGSVSGTFEAIRLEGDVDAWADANGSFTPYQTQADVFLALSQGQIDATVVTSTVANAAANSGDFEGFVVGGKAPYDIDYVALIALREEYGLLNYLDLFVNQQIRTGRYAELYAKWIGADELPDLTIPASIADRRLRRGVPRRDRARRRNAVVVPEVA